MCCSGKRIISVLFVLIGFLQPNFSHPINNIPVLDKPIYPFQRYVQVRKSYTVQHLPKSVIGNSKVIETGDASPDEGSFITAESSHYPASNNYQGTSNPVLKEEINSYKKQEVYEEKGFSDSAYDHSGNSYHGQTLYHPENDNHNAPNAASISYPQRHPPIKRLNNLDGSSSNILKYAADVLYDQDAHRHGIYKARASIRCPEVINFNLDAEKESSKLIGENQRQNPRLKGLGDKIACLKNRYFGREPLPSAIFSKPSESVVIPIRMETMEQFLQGLKKNVSPQNGKFSFP